MRSFLQLAGERAIKVFNILYFMKEEKVNYEVLVWKFCDDVEEKKIWYINGICSTWEYKKKANHSILFSQPWKPWRTKRGNDFNIIIIRSDKTGKELMEMGNPDLNTTMNICKSYELNERHVHDMTCKNFSQYIIIYLVKVQSISNYISIKVQCNKVSIHAAAAKDTKSLRRKGLEL